MQVRGGALATGLVVAAILMTGCSVADSSARVSERYDGARVPLSVEASASGVVTVVAAGDIGKSPESGRATARLIESLNPDAVLTLGDNAYDKGSLEEYRANYQPTWGAFKRITRPVPGNHEYGTSGASGYFDYFGRRVGGRPYYAWNAGAWRMYALNCEVDCGKGSAQLAWLKRDLARNGTRPALAYLHRPRFTCSEHEPYAGASALWAALQRARGRLMLAGHNHVYERFAKQNARGGFARDGLRQFVVGTGGAAFYGLDTPCARRQAAANDKAGVLVLELRRAGYRWRFVDVDGRVRDQGRGRA